MNKKILLAVFVAGPALADPLSLPAGNLFGQVEAPTKAAQPVPQAVVAPVAPINQPLAAQQPKPLTPMMVVPLSQPSAGGTPALPVGVAPGAQPNQPAGVLPTPQMTQKPVTTPFQPVVAPPVVHKRRVNPEDDIVAPYFEINRDHKAIPEPVQAAPKPAPRPAPKPLEVPLPGLGTVQGERLINHSAIIRVNGDGTDVVEVSNQFQNRISTPFDMPRIVDSSNADFKIVGSSVYIALTGKPIVIYITGSVNGDPVISLTLIPKPIPAQTVVLQLDQPVNHPTNHKKDKPETYEQHLTSVLQTVAMGEDPEGFTKGRISNIVARRGVLAVFPVSRYSNAYMDIFSYKVTNTGAKTIRLTESSFYQKGVMAVGMFPASTLTHNQSTYVYVVSNKTALENRLEK